MDADLAPALLADEAADLVKRRGLVFLPGGRVLAFDPGQPLPLSAVVVAWSGDPATTKGVRRGVWQSLPEPPPLAERLTEITLELPELPPDDLLAAGAGDIGSEAPQPDTGLASQALGHAAFGAGKALAWLGKMLGSKNLAKKGMDWMESGLHQAPKLADSVLGKQEAALRALLSALRRGDVEKALRRALPLGGDGGRGARPVGGAWLPFQNLLYSLSNLLGSSGGGGGYWAASHDLYRALEAEYRKQAELAERRGDHRRAAYIYGKLLHDYRAAAAVLSRGGLHRDAATLYLNRLDDALAAAREYEAAGDTDKALALYRKCGEHLLAGDLLRRVGDEDEALTEYRRAADQAVATGKGHYQAGELLRTRAGREDLAVPYYEQGWALRPAGSAVPCAVRLAQWHARAAAVAPLLALAAEADEYLGPRGNDGPAGEFYNELARLADQHFTGPDRDDLRDLALTRIAGKLRQRAEAGLATADLVSTLLGQAPHWAPAVVSDAQFALRRGRAPWRRPLPPSVPSRA